MFCPLIIRGLSATDLIRPAVHLRGVEGGGVAGEAEEFGDGDDLVASGLEGGDQGLHGLYGALVSVVE